MSKGTEQFKSVIKAYLDNRAQEDELFRAKYATTTRTIDDVVTFIINEVQKSGRCGFADEEIFSLAVHAIDEPELNIGNPIDCHIVSNHRIELTEEEKAEQRTIALKRYQEQELSKLQKRITKQKTHPKAENQPSLFEF